MSRYNISLDSYKIFCTVARCGNITKAAEALYLTQPSVSMAITKLEHKLNCRLFTRSIKGVDLTREGRVLYSYLEQALNLIEMGEQKYYDMQHMKAGEIIIGASDTLSSGYLLPYLKTFYERYPEIVLKVTNRTTAETIALLKKGAIDFGFVNLPITPEDNIEIIECMEIHDCLVGGARFAPLAGQGLTLPALAQYPLVLLETASNTRLFLNAYAKEHNVKLNPIIELGSSELLLQFAEINIGLTFVVKEFAAARLDNRHLFEIPLTPQIPSRSIGLIKLRNIPFSHAATQFIALLGV